MSVCLESADVVLLIPRDRITDRIGGFADVLVGVLKPAGQNTSEFIEVDNSLRDRLSMLGRDSVV